MRQIVIILMCCFSILGCKSSQEPEKPKDLISKDKMVDILIDLSVLSSAKGVNKKVLENNGIIPNKYIYNRHHIDSAQFSQSNAYYSFYIDEYKNILTRVEDSLNNLKEYCENKEEEQMKKKIKPKKSSRSKINDSILKD